MNIKIAAPYVYLLLLHLNLMINYDCSVKNYFSARDEKTANISKSAQSVNRYLYSVKKTFTHVLAVNAMIIHHM